MARSPRPCVRVGGVLGTPSLWFSRCRACIGGLCVAARAAFERTEGGIALQVNAAQGTVDLTWDLSAGDLHEYLRSAESFGYRFAPLGESRASRGRASRSLLVRFGIAAAATMNVMIFSICYYLGLDASAGAVYELIGHASLLLSALTVAVGGAVFYKTTWVSARRGLVHFDLPIALGMTLAFAGSAYAHLRFGPEAAYFDSVCAFVTLMLLGRFLQERSLERSRATLLSESEATCSTRAESATARWRPCARKRSRRETKSWSRRGSGCPLPVRCKAQTP